MIAFLLAAGSALLWGASDFSGGKASQRTAPVVVATVSEIVGLPGLVIAIVAVGGAHPSAVDMAWSAAAGAIGFTGLVLFYRALAGGTMTIAAPVTGVVSAAVPLAVGLATQRSPSHLALAGAALAIVAVALVSAAPGGRRQAAIGRIVFMATVSGTCFGLFFVLIDQANPATGMWPLLGARIGSIAVGAALLAVTRTAPRLGTGCWGWTVGCGIADTGATLLYIAASQRGLLSIVAPIASLYPATTVVLALAIDRERIRAIQAAGLTLAVAAMALTAT